MIIIKHPSDLHELIGSRKASGAQTSFVPTMGALHTGHLDLIRASVAAADLTVCSIFVNPTQFNDPRDFEKYPQTIENDIRLLEEAGADVLFLPSRGDVYPDGVDGLEHYDLGYLETILEGRYRPGHFQGVCQVMSRLLNLVQPHQLFMGRKDYQQCMVVERLLNLRGGNVRLIKCPTVRESDGLAMSSRNLRLSPGQRAVAPAIYKTLKNASAAIGREDLVQIRAQATASLEKQGFRPDYFEIADAATLLPVETPVKGQPLVALVAAYLGDIRLIDNIQVER